MREHARCRTLRRILSHALLVLGGTLLATAAAWLFSTSQASAGELDHHGADPAQQPAPQGQKSTVDTVAGRVGDTARSAVGQARSTVDAERQLAGAGSSARHTRSPHAAEARTDESRAATAERAHETAASATSAIRHVTEDVRHGAAGTAEALRDGARSGHRDMRQVPGSLAPEKLPGRVAKHDGPSGSDGDAGAGVDPGSGPDPVSADRSDADRAPEPAPSHEAKRHAAAKPDKHAHPSTRHQRAGRHHTRFAPRTSRGRAARSQGHRAEGRTGSHRHATPQPMPAGTGTANGSGHQFGNSSGVLPDEARYAREFVIGLLHSADEHAPVLVNKQPGTSPG